MAHGLIAMSFSRRNPDEPVPLPWNWWFLGGSIVCGVAAFVVAFVFTQLLNTPTSDGSSVMTPTVYGLMIVFVVLLAACLGLGYTAVHRRIRDPEDD